MLRAQPPNMLQTMSNSQEIALISIFLEDLVLTRAQVLFSPYVLTIQGRSSLHWKNLYVSENFLE